MGIDLYTMQIDVHTMINAYSTKLSMHDCGVHINFYGIQITFLYLFFITKLPIIHLLRNVSSSLNENIGDLGMDPLLM